MIEFRLLGSMRVIHAGVDLELGRRQERCLLGLLVLEAGRVVSTDRLVSLLWNDAPPQSARATLHSYVARLRGRLTPYDIRVVTRGPGYVAEVDPETVDVHRFSALVLLAQNEADPRERAAQLKEALALWQGPLLADVAGDQLRHRLGTQLEGQRLIAHELWADAELALGRHHQIVGRLTELVAAHPAREGLVAALMRARYAAGDVAGALAAFEAVRAQLADQLGLDPGPDLAELHLAILNRRPPGRPEPAREPRPPRQLPPDVSAFSGRIAQLNMLDDLIFHHRRVRPQAVIISAIAGTAGVGKTTLAIHWAHRMANRFPDGELYVNLRGFDPGGQAMSPAEAVRGFLDALQVPPQVIPAGLQAQTGLYRSLLADKQVLVILDNARDAEQVRPLLPGSPGCLVLVTSRNQLTGLVATEGAHSLALGLLSAPEARQLLVDRLGLTRVDAEPEAVEAIVALCAGLPLALAIVAARASTHPELALTALVRDLSNVRGGLDAFAGDDTATDVRAVFSLSYHALSLPAARLFRLLGVHPGPDISLAAVASLAGWTADETRARLSELEHAHMVTRRDAARWSFHDLLRAYAGELAHGIDSPAEVDESRRRMLDHYLHTAHHADHLLDRHRDPTELAPPAPGVEPESLSDHDGAMGWFTREHTVLLTLLHTAVETGFDRHAWHLAWVLAGYFERRGHWNEWVSTQTLALEAAQRAHDDVGQVRAHRSLALAHVRLGRHDDAYPHLDTALRLYGPLDDPIGEAYTHLNLNIVLEAQGRYREALFHATNALRLTEAAGHLVGQGLALNAIGWCHAHLGDDSVALRCCEQALALQQRVGHKSGESDTWDSIGFIYERRHDHAHARDAYRKALQLFRMLGDRYNEATTLIRLGEIASATGESAVATGHWQVASEILDQLGHPDLDRVRDNLRQAQTVPPSA